MKINKRQLWEVQGFVTSHYCIAKTGQKRRMEEMEPRLGDD